MCKFKRCMVSVVALGMAAVMFSGCGDSREKAAPVFREDVNAVDEPAKSEPAAEKSTVDKDLQRAIDAGKGFEEKLNKGGYSLDPNKRLGKDSNGNYVEKKCVNPYCGCVDCKCNPCECDDR